MKGSNIINTYCQYNANVYHILSFRPFSPPSPISFCLLTQGNEWVTMKYFHPTSLDLNTAMACYDIQYVYTHWLLY